MAINTSQRYAATKASRQRAELREEWWPGDDKVWLGPAEKGFFCAPRTLPLLLFLLKQSSVSGKVDPGSVYVELLSRHMGEGLIEMGLEIDHAYRAGYDGARAVRTWRTRMKVLEEAGFIKVRKQGNRDYALVLLVHPAVVVANLRNQDIEFPDGWWEAYREVQLKAKERTSEDFS